MRTKRKGSGKFFAKTALASFGVLLLIRLLFSGGTLPYVEDLLERTEPTFEVAKASAKAAMVADPANPKKRLTYVFYLSPGGTNDPKTQKILKAEAVAVLKEGTHLSPKTPELHERLGDYLVMGGKPEGASEAYLRAAALSPENPLIFDSLGVSYERQGKYEAAIQAYQTAIMLYADQHRFYFHLGNAYDKMGRKEEARRAWRRCIEVYDADLTQDQRANADAGRKNAFASGIYASDDEEAYRCLRTK